MCQFLKKWLDHCGPPHSPDLLLANLFIYPNERRCEEKAFCRRWWDEEKATKALSDITKDELKKYFDWGKKDWTSVCTHLLTQNCHQERNKSRIKELIPVVSNNLYPCSRVSSVTSFLCVHACSLSSIAYIRMYVSRHGSNYFRAQIFVCPIFWAHRWEMEGHPFLLRHDDLRRHYLDGCLIQKHVHAITFYLGRRALKIHNLFWLIFYNRNVKTIPPIHVMCTDTNWKESKWGARDVEVVLAQIIDTDRFRSKDSRGILNNFSKECAEENKGAIFTFATSNKLKFASRIVTGFFWFELKHPH